MTRRYVIIGSGAAGLAAAETMRRCDPQGRIDLISSEPYGYYSRPGLAYYLASEIPRSQLFPMPSGTLKKMGVNSVQTLVNAIDPERHTIQTSAGQVIPYDRLLIATGALAQRPDLPGVSLPAVVTLDSLEDADYILKRARKGSRAVVVGGGITALELVEGLHARGMQVVYLLRGQHYWNAVLDEIESKIIERRLENEGIRIFRETQLQEILQRKEKFFGVRLKQNGSVVDLDCALLAFAIGIQPRIQLAKAAGLKVQRGILVDQYLRSSHGDILAAGDVAQVYDPVIGDYTINSLWGPAVEQGRLAGSNMAGCETAYRHKTPFNVTRLSGLVTTIIGQVGRTVPATGPSNGDADLPGIMRGDSEMWRLPPDAEAAQTYQGDNRLRLYLRGDYMTGALLMGDQVLSRALQHFIRESVNLSALRPLLLAPQAPLYQLILAFWEDYQRRPHDQTPKIA